jgi:hypothetical protein
MNIPFSTEQFLDVFKTYNLSIWPMQIVFYFLAASSIYLIFFKKSFTNAFVGLCLAFLWAWMGIVYLGIFFSTINKAAYLFGFLFVVQGALILLNVYKKGMNFQIKKDFSGIFSIIAIAYSLIIYPLISYLLGHGYPIGPTFGVPCPTTIFTFGILILSLETVPFYLLIIPIAWSIIALNAALSFGIMEDFGLIITCIVVTVYKIMQKRSLIKIFKIQA